MSCRTSRDTHTPEQSDRLPHSHTCDKASYSSIRVLFMAERVISHCQAREFPPVGWFFFKLRECLLRLSLFNEDFTQTGMDIGSLRVQVQSFLQRGLGFILSVHHVLQVSQSDIRIDTKGSATACLANLTASSRLPSIIDRSEWMRSTPTLPGSMSVLCDGGTSSTSDSLSSYDGSNKPVSTLRQCLDEFWVVSLVTQSLSDLTNVRFKDLGINIYVQPQRLKNFILRHYTASVPTR
jgi:hypothetical protein